MLFTGVSWIKCALNQYLSGLAFSIDPMTKSISGLSGRCTILSVGYQTREGSCWMSNVMVVYAGLLQWLATFPCQRKYW